MTTANQETKRKRGRPKGSKNKPSQTNWFRIYFYDRLTREKKVKTQKHYSLEQAIRYVEKKQSAHPDVVAAIEELNPDGSPVENGVMKFFDSLNSRKFVQEFQAEDVYPKETANDARHESSEEFYAHPKDWEKALFTNSTETDDSSETDVDVDEFDDDETEEEEFDDSNENEFFEDDEPSPEELEEENFIEIDETDDDDDETVARS